MPEMRVNKKLQRFLTTHKPLKVAIGGRGSGKSIGFGDMLTFKMDTEGADIYCLREYQDSLTDSVHRVFKGSINDRLKLEGWDIQKNLVLSPGGATTKYVGAARNPDSIQSAQDYRYSWFEEAHRASQESIDKLLPTILRNIGSECWFSANPQNSSDPFSMRFIVPFLKELLLNGFYEDDMHLIVVVNWRDNPWWNDAQEALRKWDFENLVRAKYDWIWEGKFNDSVEDGLIMAEWFDACVDAHVKLGFAPIGAKMAAHDPSDTGLDSKGYAMRHGSVVLDIQEKTDGDINEGGDWAAGLALNAGVDNYTWDCDGMGVGLNRQTTKSFSGKHTSVVMFKGSEGVDFPDAIYKPIDSDNTTKEQKTNKQVFKNKRAQYAFALRDRIYTTYRAVIHGDYHDPDEMISFSSDIGALASFRSELCRMPIKPNSNGLCELYTKEEMKKKFKMKSPNLFDSGMMLMRKPQRLAPAAVVMPKPIGTMGRR